MSNKFKLSLLILLVIFSVTGCLSSTPKINSLKLLNQLLVQSDLMRVPETILINLKKSELAIKNKFKSAKEYQHKVSFGKASEERKLTVSTIFDTSANMTEIMIYNSDGSVDVKNAFKYNDKNNVTERICYNSNGSIKFKEDIEYKYDNSSNVIEAKIKNSSDNSQFTLTFVYNDKGYIIERNLSHSDGSAGSKQTYRYADNGSIIDVVEYQQDGSLLAKVEYTYNDKFFLTEIKRTIANRIDKWLYTYDDSGNISEEDTDINSKTSITKLVLLPFSCKKTPLLQQG